VPSRPRSFYKALRARESWRCLRGDGVPWRLQFRIAGTIVRTIAMTARFDHAADITLNELRAELIYPLDDAADHYFRAQRPPAPERGRAGGWLPG